MIDLSYLTEEEQEMIKAVLKRDTELKKAEEERIKKLQKTERDKGKLKYLTGEWFYETKSHRHRDRIHGSDIIRASMKHGNPVTILELSEIWPGKSSFLNSESKDVFIPPELSGILDEFPSQDSREDHYRLAESLQGTQTPSVQPQIKPRQNPFNSKSLGVESPKKTDGCLTSGAGQTPLAPAKPQQTPTYTPRIPAEQQQPDAQPHKATAKPCQTPAESLQTPAEVDDVKIRHSKHFPCTHNHHEDHAEPHSSQVSEPPASVVEQGGSVEPSPVRTALKQANVRPISISKSLENLASLPSREERWKNEPRTDITLSVEDVSAAPLAPSSSLSDPEQMKMLSVSVPAFIQQQRNGRGSDCTSVNSFYSERQRKDSTNTYLSTSSGRASLSSVSGSVMSIYSTDFGNVEVKGTIQFAINYVPKLGEFHIFIAQCRDLAAAEPKRNRSDPYVKCYLLPDKARLGKRKTTVKKKTLNPAYNEILRYKIPLENLKAHTLNLSVWHNDTFGRNSFLGEVDVDLSEWDFNNTHMMDYALKGRVPAQMSPKRVNHCMEMSGEMRVALRFLQQTSQSKKTPQTGEVQIWVKECKDLPAREGAIDPFVKCTVLPDTARKSRQKTRVVKRTANPVFNHTMVYDGFRPEDLREACVELTVWDHDRLNNHFIGGIRLCLGTGKSYGNVVDWMDSNSAEAGLWKRMIESQNEWVEDVVPLRMLVMARTMSK
ncbi:synaptotagmin-like protein 2 isoform X7 [Pygocentrus nattereri]|uniref:synaptotagmin-like protein 2 isoform X7 n=1 Tax=Pygocentrus nattereri TaxID=42514 RepID=UPI000814ABA1|nr:synaptotagmin-like protein 2 isoform X7 [Pygocentrus nattereri]